jgi:hypothetical protein
VISELFPTFLAIPDTSVRSDSADSNLKLLKMVDEIKAAGIEKFDGTDFGYWKMQIEDYLYGKKLHLPLLGSKPENMQEEEWLLLDR